MENEIGLAQQMSGQRQGRMPALEEIVALLQQGVSPDELMAMGIPLKVIDAAVQQMQMMAQTPVQEAPVEKGMAAMMAARG